MKKLDTKVSIILIIRSLAKVKFCTILRHPNIGGWASKIDIVIMIYVNKNDESPQNSKRAGSINSLRTISKANFPSLEILSWSCLMDEIWEEHKQ